MTDSDRVVPLRGRDGESRRTSSGPRHSLLAELRRVFAGRIGDLLRSMLDKVDDALFALAEKAESNAAQTQYFDAIREVRLRRQSMESGFRSSLERCAEALERPRVQFSQRGRSANGEDAFQLIDNDELEETLAINGMVGKAETQMKTALDALATRLAALLPDTGLTEDDRPLGPSEVCGAFRETAQALQLDITSKLIIYKLFDKFVMAQLGDVYEALNKLLIRGGVLPTLSSESRRRAAHSPASSGRGPAPPPAPQGPGAAVLPGAPESTPALVSGAAGQGQMTDALDASAPELLNILRQLVSSNRGPVGGNFWAGETLRPAAGGTQSSGYFAASDVLEALSSLQQASARAPAVMVDPHLSMMELRSALAERARSDTGLVKVLGETMEETIDVIEMLFDFILDDVNLPIPVKALIGRLQIPVLKVALMDKSFVRRRKHPAWELINELARAGIGVNDTAEAKRDSMFAMIERVVQRVLDEFENDVSIFSTLLRDFREYLERERRRAEAIEKRTLEQEEGRAARDAARQFVSRTINQRLAKQQVPRALENLLKNAWSRVMFLAYTKGGSEGPEWQNALGVVDRLLHGTKAQHSAAGLQQLKESWPGLMREVRDGLESVQYDPFETRKQLEELTQHVRKTYSAQLHSTATAPAPMKDETTQRFGVADTFEEGPTAILPDAALAEAEEAAEGVAEMPTDKYSAMVENVAVGTWFEFQALDRKQMRAKLSTKIPLTRTYIFVDRIGVKLAEWSFADLVEEVRSGRAAILDDSALFDRVLSAAMSRLHS